MQKDNSFCMISLYNSQRLAVIHDQLCDMDGLTDVNNYALNNKWRLAKLIKEIDD